MGGGDTTLRRNGNIERYWWTVWKTRDVAKLKVRTGIPDHQTFWEALALLLCMIIWEACFAQAPILIIGDNVPALQTALDLKGKGALGAVAREIAWRKARYHWQYSVGHLPSEHNKAPDALSRIAAPKPELWPYKALEGATECPVPRVSDIWQV